MYQRPWKILTYQSADLRSVSEPFDVSKITTPEFQAFADDFGAYMLSEDGIGLAAPQVGIQKRIITVLMNERVRIYVNPEILKASEATQEFEEGCLSVPGVYGLVRRPKRIRIQAYNRHGRVEELSLSGFPATIFQHEIDHLNGVLFIDKLTKLTRGTVKP